MPKNRDNTLDTTLSVLAPRQAPDPTEILSEMRNALIGAQNLDYLSRMERCHEYRYCFWEGQSPDGRKRITPDMGPEDIRRIFPWPNAADNRVPIVDEIINERVTLKMAALDMAQRHIGPRDMDPDQETDVDAAVWDRVAKYYFDEDDKLLRDEAARFIDIAEEYGHALLWVYWHEEKRAVGVDIAPEDLQDLFNRAAVRSAAPGDAQPDPANDGVSAAFQQMLSDPELRGELVDLLLENDPDMPASEARRVALHFQAGKPGRYYKPQTYKAEPRTRALRPFIDVFYPATTERIQKAKWVAIAEWLTDVELREKVASQGWDNAAVETIIESYAGSTFDFSTLLGLSEFDWALSGGNVGWGIRRDAMNVKETKLFQVLHTYYVATSLGDVPALYHTVLHGRYDKGVLHHECDEDAHGQYPVIDHVRERKSTFLLESRGVGEVSHTDQNQLKRQVDYCDDSASIHVNPPLVMPKNMMGAKYRLRPGAQIPQNGLGEIKPLEIGGDATVSMEVQKAAMDRLNGYWGRGMEIDPSVKLARQRVMARDILSDMRGAQRLMFQLIQQYAPEDLKTTYIAGLPTQLKATRAQIQGQVSLSLTYDPADMDPDLVEKRLTVLKNCIAPLDTQGQIPTADILRVSIGMLFPAFVGDLMNEDPNQVQDGEVQDESNILGKMTQGVESPYIPRKPGQHETRLQYLHSQIAKPSVVPGQPTPLQSTIQQSPDIQALVKNRILFHQRQIEQMQENPVIGRQLVQPVQPPQPGDADAPPLPGSQPPTP